MEKSYWVVVKDTQVMSTHTRVICPSLLCFWGSHKWQTNKTAKNHSYFHLLFWGMWITHFALKSILNLHLTVLLITGTWLWGPNGSDNIQLQVYKHVIERKQEQTRVVMRMFIDNAIHNLANFINYSGYCKNCWKLSIWRTRLVNIHNSDNDTWTEKKSNWSEGERENSV